MNKKEKKVEKIIVKQTDELIDLISKINNSDAERLLIVFADESDLLYSPINLKVLQQISDENNRSLILQIVQNKPGVLNAKTAGLPYTESVEEIPEELWMSTESETRTRIKETRDRLKGIHKKNNNEPQSEEVNNLTESEQVTEDIQISESVAAVAEVTPSDVEMIEEATNKEAEDRRNSFQDTIDKALNKSKEEIQSGRTKIVEEGGFVVALDEDISNIEPANKNNVTSKEDEISQEDKSVSENDVDEEHSPHKQTFLEKFGLQKTDVVPDETIEIDDEIITNDKQPTPAQKNNPQHINSLIGKDFVTNKVALPKTINLSKESLSVTRETPEKFENEQSRINKKAKVISIPSERNYKKLALNILLKVGLPVLALLIVSGFLAYSLLPMAKVKMYIESKPVTLEKTYTGQPGSVFDNELATIAVKSEEVKKERADSAMATGTGYRGDKASGIVTVTCIRPKQGGFDTYVSLSSGTILKTSSDKQYTLNSDINNLLCPNGTASVGVTAIYLGDDYNVPPNTSFTIDGYSTSDLTIANNSAFTGGSKSAFKSVSQEDYDKLLNTLKQVTFDEATEELKEMKSIDGWAVIESTIKNELDGEPTADYPVGSETDIFNITIKTKSTALYYKTSDITAVQNEMLMTKAEELDLFNTSSDIDMQPLSNIESNMTVEKVEDTTVTVKLILSGLVMPAINREDISSNLAGLSWDEGATYLAKLDYVTKPTELEFTPTYFPRFLWHFPSSTNRIVVTIEEVESSDTNTATSTDESL